MQVEGVSIRSSPFGSCQVAIRCSVRKSENVLPADRRNQLQAELASLLAGESPVLKRFRSLLNTDVEQAPSLGSRTPRCPKQQSSSVHLSSLIGGPVKVSPTLVQPCSALLFCIGVRPYLPGLPWPAPARRWLPGWACGCWSRAAMRSMQPWRWPLHAPCSGRPAER